MSKIKMNLSLPVTILKEDGVFVAYSPAIDLSTVGETFEDAQSNFEEAAQIFFEELMEAGTLEVVLAELGWKKKKKYLTPPTIISNRLQRLSLDQSMPFTYA